MNKEQHTNKDRLVLGLKRLAIAVVLLFAGPTLVYVVVSNNEKPFSIPLLIISFLICALAIYFIYKGIKTIISSVFD
jgi:CRISPR/Cas system-associated protein Csm6